MKVTIFNSQKTLSKVPTSPYKTGEFVFETKYVNNIKDVFNYVSSHFTLNMPLKKSIKSKRLKDDLFDYFNKKIEYIILDIDKIKSLSDRELTIKYFRDSEYQCILGESRSKYNIKGVLKVEPMTQQQGKEALKEISKNIPGKLDLSSLNYASYQAPILKNNILYENLSSQKEYKAPVIQTKVANKVKVPNNIEQICIDEFVKQGYSFDTRINDGYRCSHPSEIKSKGGFTWNKTNPFMMFHWNKDRNLNIWDTVVKTPEYKSYIKEESKQQVKNIIPDNKGNVSARYLTENSEKVEDFLDNYDILTIESPMGTGKSAVIEEVIHQSRKRGLRVLFLTNRISLADDIEQKYDGIKHYLGTDLEDNKYNFGDDLVLQIDSLHKFSTKYFDVCIMDEAATTMMHLLTLEKHQKSISTKIFSLKKKKLVLADAFLFDDMVDIFGKNKLQIKNNYRDDVLLDFYEQKDKFIFDLIEEAKERPITFSSGSIQMLKIVELLSKENNLRTITISSETSKEEKKLIYKSMSSKKPNWDILMYSPTLTVGVSNENEICTHYHFDTGLSMNVLSSIQMIKRTRTAKKIKMFLDERIKYKPTDIFKIQSELTDFNNQDEDGDMLGISEAGVNLSKIIKLNNILENRHKLSFIQLLKLQFNTTSKNINKITEKVQPFIIKLTKIIKQNEKEKILNIFEKFKELSPEALSDIEYKLFATTKEEEYYKIFSIYKSDDTLDLSDELLDILITEEINTTGAINAYKLNKKDDFLLKRSIKNNFMLSLKEAKKYQYKYNLKEYGFKRKHNRYVLNETLKRIFKTNI